MHDRRLAAADFFESRDFDQNVGRSSSNNPDRVEKQIHSAAGGHRFYPICCGQSDHCGSIFASVNGGEAK